MRRDRKLVPLFRVPICTVCKRPITKQYELDFEFKDREGNPIHDHCANYLSKKAKILRHI